MTLSAPKPAYQLHEPEASEAEPFEPELADHPEEHPDDWHELPCSEEPAPEEPEDQSIEDLHASFHEQLAMLARALDSDDEHKLDVGGEPELVGEHDETVETLGAADDAPPSAAPRLLSIATLRNALNGRARGFVLGLGASIAAGGAVLVLANGSSEQPAMANSVLQGEPRAASASLAAETPEVQLRASLLDESEPGPAAIFGTVEQRSTNVTEAGGNESAADIATVVPRMVLEPADEPRSADRHTHIAQQASDLADAFAAATGPEGGDDLRDEPPAEVATSFETTVETASEESSSDDVEPPAQSLASAREAGPTAHVVRPVNMRAGPDNSAAVLAVVPEGKPVEVVQCDQWCEVVADGQRGWIYKDFLSGAVGS